MKSQLKLKIKKIGAMSYIIDMLAKLMFGKPNAKQPTKIRFNSTNSKAIRLIRINLFFEFIST